ncbi:P-loop NTPase fold protein [Dysgonomonas sp. 25]|uniref:P-loop NTPase fold protein n=1 Tax=Dysgonomonas sp. 25 TaxID=2302933 RepID=UPI0013D5D979|nr:P-loop NTPase fold protein [Dysgonomonas sp. 25]NDV69341.1 hypothetical protein [Dysgonomonas sp. 25]
MTQVVIKLSESTNAKRFADSNLIHSDELKKAKGWINDRIEKIKKKEIDEKERLHDTITILGSRGSGKTSFLLSLLNTYTSSEDIEVIDIIDPTLIEEKGHIFLTIISQIADVVEKKLSKSDCNPESKAYLTKNQWKEKLKSLAAGIPSIDGIGGNYDSWQDPEFIMDKGLKNVRAAKKLESDFHELLKLGLKILGKKVFIIALDDIDIDFRKGWPVLETIRKYLTSPYLITLLSGDLKLFSKAIRKQQWKNFGKALLKNEGEQLHKMDDYEDLVTEMEGQYLQKVMQPQRRIHLTTIQEKINIKGKENIGIYINKEDDENRIDLFYDSKLSKFGINNPYQAEAYRSFLLSLPIRTQIQFLSEFENINSIKEVNFIDAFLSDLYEKRVDIEIAKSSSKYLDSVILKLLIHDRVLDEAYQLQPTTTDISLNSSLTALSFLFSQKTMDNPYLIFDYFIKVGYLRNLLSVLGYQEKNEDKKAISMKTPSIEGLCCHSAIYKDGVLRDIACYMTAYLQAILENNRKGNSSWGMIKLPALGLKQNEKKEDIPWRMDDVFRNATKYQRTIAFFPLSISQHNHRNEGFPVYSIYVLLATIGELIKKVDENDVTKGILELSQIRSYPMPNFNVTGSTETYDIEMPDYEGDSNDERLNDEIRNWVNRYPKGKSVSPHLLGKISTRFFYSLSNIEGKSGAENLAESIHARIIILMNSILVEDAKENLKNVNGLNINNPNYKSTIFINNLKAIKAIIDKNNTDKTKVSIDLTFSKWILSCPLFLLYLNPNDKDQNDKLTDILVPFISTKKFNANEVMKYSVFNKLSQVKHSNPNEKKAEENKSQIRIVGKIDFNSLSLPMFRSQKESERKRVKETLKTNKIPREWFDNKVDKKEQESLNKLIRENTSHLFKEGEEKKRLESDWIRQFRNYLAENDISW